MEINTPQKAAEVKRAVEVVRELKTQTGKIGFGQIGNITPNWSKWVFRIYFYLLNAGFIWVAADPNIPPVFKERFFLYGPLSAILVHGLSKMVGIDTKQIEADVKDGFHAAGGAE